jgi:hypothetical protein
MTKQYIRRGYPAKIMAKHLKVVEKLKQDDLLEVKVKPDPKLTSDRIILTLEYNPANPDVLGIIRENWPLIECSSKLSALFPSKPMLAHKKSRNIKDILVKSVTEYPTPESNPQDTWDPFASKCRRYNCPLCPKGDYVGRIKSLVTKETYRTVTNITCETKNVIYCLICSICGKQYVGETKRSFRIRISEHLGDIRNKRTKKPIARHFNSKGHSLKCLKATILETVPKDPDLEVTTVFRRKRVLLDT